MKVYVPGFPVQHIDEPAPAVQPPTKQPSSQVLDFTRTAPKQQPLTQNLRTDGPSLEQWLKAGYAAKHYPPTGYAEVPSAALTEYKAKLAQDSADDTATAAAALEAELDALAKAAHAQPHSVNEKPKVE